MDKISPVVITSKPASELLNKIKSEHAGVLTNIQNQSLRVAQFNQQKEMAQKEKMVQDSTVAKDKAEADRKTKELQIKEQALSMP